MARRRRPGRSRRGDGARRWIGVALIAAAGLALGALALASATLRPADLDPETLCRRDQAPAAHTIVLVDATDRLAPRHRRRLDGVIQEERGRLATGDRLSVLLLDARDAREPRTLFSLCNPGDGRSVNPWIANTGAAQRRWEAAFAEPLADAVAQAARGRPGDASPIVEALAAAAHAPLFDPGSRRRIVLVSDLLEHHPGGFSLFDPTASLETFAASSGAARSALDLTGVSLRVTPIDWPERAALQRNAREAFWEPLLDASGAEAVTWDETL
jgi:hypothetical protein